MVVLKQRRELLRSGLGAVVAGVVAGMAAADEAQAAQVRDDDPATKRLPDGQLQADAMLKADYEQNVKDARELTALAKSIELDFDKNDQNVLSLALLRKLDDVEKLTKRIRGRVRR
jgi:succinate dehydrogenase/fumarate reductase flavoprotein subunit